MIGRKDQTHVNAEKYVMDDNEEDGPPASQQVEDQAKIEYKMATQQDCFSQSMFRFGLEQKLNAYDPHIECFHHHQGKEHECLVFHHDAQQPLLAPGLFRTKGENWNADIGVDLKLIGMAMMPVMLVNPPSTTYADQQVTEYEADEIVLPNGVENLS